MAPAYPCLTPIPNSKNTIASEVLFVSMISWQVYPEDKYMGCIVWMFLLVAKVKDIDMMYRKRHHYLSNVHIIISKFHCAVCM